MAKRNRERKLISINPETRNSVIAVILIGIAIILILVPLEQAGPLGKFIYGIMNGLFGIGYFLIPFFALVIALLFFLSRQPNIAGSALLGTALTMISALGLIDLIAPAKGGLIGKAIGLLEVPFGYPASLVITGTGIVAAFMLTLNASIRIRPKEKGVEEKLPVKEPDKIEIKIPEEIKAESPKIPDEEKEKNKVAPTKAAAKPQIAPVKIASPYVPPPLSLIKSSVEKPMAGDLRANANIIKRTLDSFGIPVEMGEINIGPKVTRYTLKPAEGVKLSRITALNPDLALSLAAHPIRIEAPIPGKSLVGIEVPNKSAATVRLGSLINHEDFIGSGPLEFILGRDINGLPILADIDKMPHLLIAGATGSGKSVCIHSLIVSLLYKNSPEILRFIMIDPKRVELSVYNGIPHLVTPVITDGKKSVNAFRWAIQEMERRYEILLEAGSRDIQSYNHSHETPLPYILVIVDELADLMTAHGRETEGSIVRLAQMARATGLHLILSTQRPSVEIITGLIKANITCRVALQVASQIDSRTILDMAGAEKLLGGGDMLYVSSELSKPKRIQGAYISEEEINAVADFLKNNNANRELAEKNRENLNLEIPAFSNEDFEENNGDDDVLYSEALNVVREAKKASASLLQRRLKIGYARAARLLDIMEHQGIIGPGDGAKPRDVYFDENNSSAS